MNPKKTAILLINVGTPDAPTHKAVRKYLTQFLNDKRVIDLPWLGRKLLVNLIIIPFRTPKSTKLYQRLWTKDGSPLLNYSQSLLTKLQNRLDVSKRVFLAMRYQNPSIKKALNEIKSEKFEKVVVLPLYPQYATSTTLTSMEEVLRIASKIKLNSEIIFRDQFFDHPKYLNAVIAQSKNFDLSSYDHILFSYHGLPINQVEDTHPGNSCHEMNCTQAYGNQNALCYHAACYETTRLLSTKLNLTREQHTVCFQSRFAKKWLSPFTDDVIIDLAKKGKKRILVFCPAFVADCLETTIEISYEYDELFKENGGEKIDLVPSLNDSEKWVEALESLVDESSEE